MDDRHSAHLFVKTQDIQTNGPEPRTHTMDAESGNPMVRAWCDECGCGLWIRSPKKKPGMTNLKAGMETMAQFDIVSLEPTPAH